jgi:hypothetical protein
MIKSVLFFIFAAHISTAIKAQYEWRMNSAGRYVYVKTVTVPVNTGTLPSTKRTTGATTTTFSNNKYESVVVFSENLASVAKNRKYGFIDEYDKLVIPFTYDYADNFFKGRALVKLNGKYGFIDKNGTIVIPLEYDKADRFEGYTTKVQKGSLKYEIDRNGKIFSTLADSDPNKKGKAGYTYKGDYKNGLALIINNSKQGYVDLSDNEVIPAVYDNLLFFSPMSNKVEAKLNGKWGIINKNNQVIIPFIYDHIGIYDNLTRACLNNKWGTIDSLGKTIIPFIYEEIDHFYMGLAAVQLNEKWGYINEKGKIIIPIMYDQVVKYIFRGRYKDELFAVGLKNKFGVINKANNKIIPLIYDKVSFSDYGYIQAKLELKDLNFDYSGKVLH